MVPDLGVCIGADFPHSTMRSLGVRSHLVDQAKDTGLTARGLWILPETHCGVCDFPVRNAVRHGTIADDQVAFIRFTRNQGQSAMPRYCYHCHLDLRWSEGIEVVRRGAEHDYIDTVLVCSQACETEIDNRNEAENTHHRKHGAYPGA